MFLMDNTYKNVCNILGATIAKSSKARKAKIYYGTRFDSQSHGLGFDNYLFIENVDENLKPVRVIIIMRATTH